MNAPFATNPFAAPGLSRNPFLLQRPSLSFFLIPLGARAYTFQDAAQTILKEAIQMVSESAVPGPGSEYVSAALGNAGGLGTVNPATGIRRTKNNPSGTPCTNPVCIRRGTCDGHDHQNCYQEGGGKAGQAPWQRKKKGTSGPGGNGETRSAGTAAAATTPSATSAPPPTTASGVAALAANPPLTYDGRFMDLSCATLARFEASDTARATLTILDSGTTSHLIKDPSYFWTFNPDGGIEMRMANQGTLLTRGSGECVALLTLGNNRIRLKLKDCLLAPEASLNLLSVSRMVETGWDLHFTGSPAQCQVGRDGVILGTLEMSGHLCPVSLEFIPPPQPAAALHLSAFVPVSSTPDLWHARLGHAGGKASGILSSSSESPPTLTGRQSKCESCVIAKHPHRPYPSSNSCPTTTFLELVHSDICGPFPISTLHGKHYFILFLDDFTNVINVQLLATKDQALEAWRTVRARWENKYDARVKALQTDNGGEYVSLEFERQLRNDGIEHRKSIPYAHQQNGKAERAVRTLEGHARACLTQAGLSAGYFGEAVLLVAYLWNVTPSRSLPKGHTPFEILHRRKADLSHLRVFGARCFARIPPELRRTTDSQSIEAIFMGYPDGVKGWRLRNCTTGAFFNSRDVVFDEGTVLARRDASSPLRSHPEPSSAIPRGGPSAPPSTTPASPLPIPRQSACLRQMPSGKAVEGVVPSEGAVGISRDDDLDSLSSLSTLTESEDEEASPEQEELMETPTAQVNFIITEQSNLSIRSDTRRDPSQVGYDMAIPPATFDEAMKRSDHLEWKAAMERELGLMKEMGVWELMEPPPGRKLIGNRWVFEFKPVDPKGGSRFKARLVAQGFSQVPGIDFHHTYAPVARQSSIKILIALAGKYNWELDCFDAKRAFLHGRLSEEIYMKQPRGFEQYGKEGVLLACKMYKSLYGLKQAAFDWYELLCSVLEAIGFNRSGADLAVFIFDKMESGARVICIIVWHVDDGLAGSNSRQFLDWVKKTIADRFGISDMGAVSIYLGIQIERNRDTKEIWIHQESYIDHLCAEYGLMDANPVSLPMDPKAPFGSSEQEHAPVEELQTAYRKLTRELIYLSTCTRPDIAQAVQRLSQQCSHPEPRHYAAAKRVVRYLKGTKELRLHFGNPTRDQSLHGYSDSDWATSPEDSISVSGFVWYYYGGPIAHASRKQQVQALSSTEAEYVALTPCTAEGLWIHSLLETLHQPTPKPTVIRCDNTGAIALASTPMNHSKMRQIRLRYHFVRDRVREGTFLLEWVPSHQNVADTLTKSLTRTIFRAHRLALSLVSR